MHTEQQHIFVYFLRTHHYDIFACLLRVLDDLPVVPAAPQQNRAALVMERRNQHPALRDQVNELKRLRLVESVVATIHILQLDLRRRDAQRLRPPPRLEGVDPQLIGAALEGRVGDVIQ